ncbi:MAG TPA: hypothetical protein GX510_00770 [Firmicutes bacterium]|nr:hypothetical protein [Candidatus Fermentithermobacillaceae bacterium]
MKRDSVDMFLDTSVLVAFSAVSRLDILWMTYPGKLVIPRAVDEVLHEWGTCPVRSQKRAELSHVWQKRACFQ